MAKSPKVFYPKHPNSRFRRVLTSPLFCLALGVLGVAFGIFATLRPLVSPRKCGDYSPRSVSVEWRDGAGGGVEELGMERHKVMAFVGIQTGFASGGRRKALRKTWMPSDRDGLRRLEESTGLAFRFVIGRTRDKSKMTALRKEVEEYDDFVLLDIEEEYSNLPYKTLAFFKAAYRLYDSDFYVKADDDIYLRPDRLSLLLAKDRPHSRTYLGCMKKGPVFTNPKLKWYEPLSPLLGSEYFLHAYGPLYALSAEVVASVVTLRNDSFRMFSNEDVTIGAWMLAMNVEHENERALCQPECSAWSIGVWDIPKCSGLCDPEKKLIELHQMENCSSSPTTSSKD